MKIMTRSNNTSEWNEIQLNKLQIVCLKEWRCALELNSLEMLELLNMRIIIKEIREMIMDDYVIRRIN